jgi:hypothetical protein
MHFHGITPFDAGDPGRPALVNLQAENSVPVNFHLAVQGTKRVAEFEAG